MQTLLTVIMAWLSINFSLPAIDEQPAVKFVSAEEMVAIREGRLLSNGIQQTAAQPGRSSPSAFSNEIYAFYDDSSGIIFLSDHWQITSPADLSVLVHELTHHMQNIAGLKYDCPQAREKPAYEAQAAWLQLFGKSLPDEFDVDPMTILVRTHCMY